MVVYFLSQTFHNGFADGGPFWPAESKEINIRKLYGMGKNGYVSYLLFNILLSDLGSELKYCWKKWKGKFPITFIKVSQMRSLVS